MIAVTQRGNVIEVPWKGSHQRRVVAYTYVHPSGTIAATLPADLSVAGWFNVDVREARLSDDQTVDWSGMDGELRREVFSEATERPPQTPGRRTISKYASVFEVVRFAFGEEFAREYEDLCNGRIPERYREISP